MPIVRTGLCDYEPVGDSANMALRFIVFVFLSVSLVEAFGACSSNCSCNVSQAEGFTVDCSGNELVDLPESLPENTTNL